MAAESKTGKRPFSSDYLFYIALSISAYEKLKERYASITTASKIAELPSGNCTNSTFVFDEIVKRVQSSIFVFQLLFTDDKIKAYLKKLDILDTLPDKQRDLLSHYARAKKETELHTLETSYFENWFLLRCEKKFADMELIDDLSLTIAKYQEELDEDNKKIAQLEAFLTDSHVKTADLSESELVMTEQKLAGATASFVSLS